MSAELWTSAEFWTAVGSIGTCVAVVYTLLHAAIARWIRVPVLEVTKQAPLIIMQGANEHLVVPVTVKNRRGWIRGKGAEKVSLSIRKIDFTQGTGGIAFISTHKRSLVTWQNTNSETAISIPCGVEEQAFLFSVPKAKQATGGTGFGTGLPATEGTLYIGDSSDCPDRAGKWVIWFLLSAESCNSRQYTLTIEYKGGWPTPTTPEMIDKIIALQDVSLKEIR